MLRFIHTSDWQLGAAFGQIPGDAGAMLRAQRFDTLGRIAEVAHARAVDCVLVAGDVFDAHTVSNEVVTQAMQRLGEFAVPVYAIPGNHDFARAPESVYQRPRLRQRKPDNVHILDTPEPVPLPGKKGVLLPCPLLQRHTVGDPTGWLDAHTDVSTEHAGHRIALAHGSVVSFEAEDGGTTPNLIDPSVVQRANLDYLALGDWHGLRQIDRRAWYSGTPEPDRFKDNDPGYVLVVDVATPGATPSVEAVYVGGCRWVRKTAHVHGHEDVASLEQWLSQLERPQQTLLHLTLDGILGMQAKAQLEHLLTLYTDALLHLRLRGAGVRLAPTEAELDALGAYGLTGRVVERLRSLIQRDDDQSDRAALALQELFRITTQRGDRS